MNSSATTTKLRELLSVIGDDAWEIRHATDDMVEIWIAGGPVVASVHYLRDGKERANAKLIAAAPALARLVLTLSGELRDVLAVYAPGHETCHDGCAAASAQEALAAVEEL